jgi:hypothetical protein
VLTTGPIIAAATPTPQTSSQTVKCSHAPYEPNASTEAEAFPLVRPYVVGATGFEPVTSSVSEQRRSAVLDTVLAGRAQPSTVKLSALLAFS